MVIGISGFIGSGKDTIAAHLVNKHGFHRRGLADTLKEEVAERLEPMLKAYAAEKWPDREWSSLLMHEMLYVNRTPTIRALLQCYGTEVRRKDDDYYWVNQWFNWFDLYRYQNVVVPDIRFYNEVNMVRHIQDGLVVRVVRPGHGGDSHASETTLAGYKDWDHVFQNDGTVEELNQAVDDWMASL